MSTAHWLALTQVAGVGGVTARRLLEQFGSIEAIFEASVAELVSVPRVSDRIAHAIREAPLDLLDAELLQLCEEGIVVLTWDDGAYPANLRATADAPALLFVRGDILPEDENAVAVVGTRQPSPEGLQAAQALARELAWRRLTVVSGLAQGVDTAAHQGALEAGGRTLAVLGSGLRVIHPQSNAQLAGQIVEHGALISELHPSAPPLGRHLMARDRIISGLCRAVIVVEAGVSSGSMDTAAKARAQGRLLLAVDGGSEGTTRLLTEGALPVLTADLDFDALATLIAQHAVAAPDSPASTEQLTLGV